MPALLLAEFVQPQCSHLNKMTSVRTTDAANLAVQQPQQGVENRQWVTLMSYEEARKQRDTQPSDDQGVLFADRGDEEDYRVAAEQVLDELQTSAYKNDERRGYDFSLLGALEKQANHLVECGRWQAMHAMKGPKGQALYIDRERRSLVSLAAYYRERGVAQFQAEFGCFLDERAAAIKRKRLAQHSRSPSRSALHDTRCRQSLSPTPTVGISV